MKFIVTVVTLVTVVQAINYCSQSLCPAGRKHIACQSSNRFASTCPADARIVDVKPFISTILHIHNSYRNLIAGGGVSGYQPAARMATIQWDPELTTLATLNVRQCAMKHDQCRNTARFRKAGQNLAMTTYTGPEKRKSNMVLVKDRVNAWWNEYKYANMNIINSYPTSRSGPAIGHFTTFVRDGNNRIGCAIARFKRGRKSNFLIACNYATTNIATKAIYIAGRATASCRSGNNPSYRNLCSTAEVYTGL